MKMLALIALTTCLANVALANVYIKATSGQIVEVTEAELDKANRSAGLTCTSEGPGPAPTPAPQPTNCQPEYHEMRGYAVFMGETQLTDFLPNQQSVIGAYQKLVLRGSCGNAPLACDFTMRGGYMNYVTINGTMASPPANDRDMLAAFNAYRAANICK